MIDECGSIHTFALMAKPNLYASKSQHQAEVNGQTIRGESSKYIRNFLCMCKQHLDDGYEIDADRIPSITGPRLAAIKAKGFI